ncbi:transcription factor bHLH118-like [Salvia miltiorrhiza]|uniref:transcription factor bHLH118-like n=1 Tax=Salvia miltiorrhiza TaxID=226208 RepID=UPI0025AC4128|nr:transcription factor bHLH118-like [Salvia miltiorrhiza]
MFPISSDGVIEDPWIFLEQDGFLLADIPILDGNEHPQNSVKKRPRKAPTSAGVEENSSDSKKTAHRFTEKQRRQEMTTLYASLRSLLPLEYIKGKRAVSDHMDQAANYINDMKKKIEEMKRRRESLRNVAGTAAEAQNQTSNATDYCVKINVFTDGVEILISSSLNKDCFPLSMVLSDLLNRQLHVINCVSTRGQRCYLHKIHIQLNNSTSIDVAELQERLVDLLQLA